MKLTMKRHLRVRLLMLAIRYAQSRSVSGAVVAFCGGIVPIYIGCSIASHAKLQALAHVECIRCFGNELRAEPAKKREHVFPSRIDESDFGDVNEQPRSIKAMPYERASTLRVIARESTLEFEGHSICRIVYLNP
jgi:hypothetical protein